MVVFTIDADDNVTAHDSSKEIEGTPEGTRVFSSAEELANVASGWPATRLVEIWNSFPA
jgi:hypothetical protein